MTTWVPRAAALGVQLLAVGSVLAADEQSNIFAGSIANAIITLVIFLLVVWVLGKFAWPPVLQALNDREATIRRQLEEAKAEREAATKLLTDYQAQLDKAREEASAIVAEGRRDAETTARRIQDEARRESEETIARARREIQLATDTARKELHDEAAELAVRVARRVVRKELAPADHKELVAEALREMAATGGKLN